MKLSKNLRLEIRALLTFLGGAWVGGPIVYMAYQKGYFYDAPPWVAVCIGLFMVFLAYVWWRQGLSADKTKFEKPPLW